MSQTPPSAPVGYATPQPRESLVPAGLKRSLSSISGPLIGLLVVVAIFGTWRPGKFLTTCTWMRVR